MTTISAGGWRHVSGAWALWTLRGLKELKKVCRQVRTQDQQGLFPSDCDPNLQNPDRPAYSKPLPGVFNTWRPPGLQQLLKPRLQESWEWGFHLPQPSLVSPPTSGSILSTAVLQRLEYVFRGEGDGQRGQETQARGSLCWHTAL